MIVFQICDGHSNLVPTVAIQGGACGLVSRRISLPARLGTYPACRVASPLTNVIVTILIWEDNGDRWPSVPPDRRAQRGPRACPGDGSVRPRSAVGHHGQRLQTRHDRAATDREW